MFGGVVVDVRRGEDGLKSESRVWEGRAYATFEFREKSDAFVADGDSVGVILLQEVDLGEDSMGEEGGGQVVEAVLQAQHRRSRCQLQITW
jgi:hypothetical protein